MSKHYLIVGATSGIGEACVYKLCNDQNIIYAVGRNAERLNYMRDECKGDVRPIIYDLHDLDNIKDIFSICQKDGIKLDGMIYSAGIDGMWPVKVNATKNMQEMMTINCFAFVELGRHFYSKRYSNDGAAIVAISSIASLTHEKGMSSYNASKAALNSYVKTMAREFVARNIRVNAILPAGVDTLMAEEKKDRFIDIQNGEEPPLGLIPREQVAEQVAFLLSENAMYLTGEWITMGAGVTY